MAILTATSTFAAERAAAILVYHRFGASVADSMTTRNTVFEAQIARLRQDGYTMVSLTHAVAGLDGKLELAPKTVAITVDDGHRSVYTDLLPIIRREHLPVALFIYPSAISNASYAMTWQQLAEIVGTGLVEVHSHTYWHPNFRDEKRRLAPDRYREFVRDQMEKPRRVLKAKLGVDAPFLAWPFGIHDTELEAAAAAAGYRAAFMLGEREATSADSLLALPRYLIVDSYGVAGLTRLLHDDQHRAKVIQP
ncbi:polysaccharide deacetylase family protein [Uliginosibacterium gangwonense]|uniref:polysaccharide deacetylase family protein n=1 Tax=Uliginosibacterium gangwonense TaxID=392736 RepID=UPI003CCC1B8A